MADEKNEKSPFTVDETSRGGLVPMPSITRLLNRKKLVLSNSPPRTPVEQASEIELPKEDSPSETAITFAPPELNEEVGFSEMIQTDSAPIAEPPPEPAPIQTALVQARPAKIRSDKTCQVHLWDYNLLRSNTDPLAKAILSLIENGATSALFLALVSPPPGAPVPHFLGSALAGDPSKQNIWTGLKWDPVIVPSVWNYFVRSGYVELSPPGTRTDQMSQRNVMRGAFGILPDEWLLLVRVGPENMCRGALAVVSKKSMVNELSEIMNLLAQTAPKAA